MGGLLGMAVAWCDGLEVDANLQDPDAVGQNKTVMDNDP